MHLDAVASQLRGVAGCVGRLVASPQEVSDASVATALPSRQSLEYQAAVQTLFNEFSSSFNKTSIVTIFEANNCDLENVGDVLSLLEVCRGCK